MRQKISDLIHRRRSNVGSSKKRQVRAKLQLESLEKRTVFATITVGGGGEVFTWIGDGGADNLWSNPANWSVSPSGSDLDGIPDSEDDVIFDSSSTDQSIMDLGFGGYGGYGGYGGSAVIKSLTLDWDGDLFIDGHLEVTSQVDWLSGKISGRQQNTEIATTLYISNGATMNIDGLGTKILDHDIVNDGIINWEGGDVQWEDEARIINSGKFFARAIDGKFERTEPGVFYFESAFTNQDFAEFVREGGGTSQFIGIDFNNRGFAKILGGSTFEVLSSTLFSSSYRQQFGYTPFEQPSQTQVVGTIVASDFQVSGGELVGTGVVRGPVFNFNGTVSPGASGIGTLTIQGNYVQGPFGALKIETGLSSASDKLVVTQEATLDGTLGVIRRETPALGDQFEILQFARRNGDFATKNGVGGQSNLALVPLFGTNNLRLLAEFTLINEVADVTGSVSLTFVGCTWNSRSRTWIQTVSIKNTSSAPITGPFYLVFDGNPTQVANRTGITRDGKAYIRVNVATLAPGQSTPFITLSTAVPMRPSKVFAGAGVI